MAQNYKVLLDPCATKISPMMFLPAAEDISCAALGAYIKLYLKMLVHGYQLNTITPNDLANFGLAEAAAELLNYNLLTINDGGTFTLKPIPGLG